MTIEKKKAVVIGASMAGLLAARVLNDFYEEVVILERDDLSFEGKHRRGVPHGRHAHALLAGGQKVLERLFPGMCDELVAAGAVPADPQLDGTWYFEGGALCKAPSGTTGVLTSRPFLESAIRRKVRSMERIEIIGCKAVRGLMSTSDRGRVTGVITDDRPIDADLVVDATGRGSQSAVWLESLGFRRAREEKVEVQLVYKTRIFKARPELLPNDKFVVVAPTPEGKRGGVIGVQENDTWIVTLFGHFGQVAPDDLEGYIEYARSLPSPLVYNAIRHAEPIGDAVTFRFPASTRRHYEELSMFPEGFLVFGDAICSFNPIYGQGMSVAALQASALQETLLEGRQQVRERFFNKASKVIDNPWNIAVGADLKMPETVGPRSPAVNLINWYIGKVHRLAHHDPVAAVSFNRVAQLLDAPTSLMRPSMIVRVLGGIWARRFGSLSRDRESLMTTAEPVRRLQ